MTRLDIENAKKKLSSLAKKYFSIPDQFLKFYPQLEGVVPKLESQDNKPKRKKRKLDNDKSSSTVKKKVGRPKKVVSTDGLGSKTKFFRPERREIKKIV